MSVTSTQNDLQGQEGVARTAAEAPPSGSASRSPQRARRRARLAAVAGAVLANLGLWALGAPLSGAGIKAAHRAPLVLMHVVTAAFVVPGMRRTPHAR